MVISTILRISQTFTSLKNYFRNSVDTKCRTVIYYVRRKEDIMPIAKDKARLVATVDKEIEEKVIALSKEEKRSISSMTSILIEEAINNREKQK